MLPLLHSHNPGAPSSARDTCAASSECPETRVVCQPHVGSPLGLPKGLTPRPDSRARFPSPPGANPAPRSTWERSPRGRRAPGRARDSGQALCTCPETPPYVGGARGWQMSPSPSRLTLGVVIYSIAEAAGLYHVLIPRSLARCLGGGASSAILREGSCLSPEERWHRPALGSSCPPPSGGTLELHPFHNPLWKCIGLVGGRL